MACYSPLQGWRSKTSNTSGKHSIVFTKSEGVGEAISLPCGLCIGCRINYCQSWAIRCVHELESHEFNSFVTLTYDDEHIPKNNGFQTLKREHLTKFLKRLRKYFDDVKIRYFGCGEYGSKTARPHYHLILFGIDFKDKQEWKTNYNNDKIYTSEILQNLWSDPKTKKPYGFVTTASVSYQSASYVARYSLKKLKGKSSKDGYERICPITGEIIEIEKEFSCMSTKPGIGKNWFDQWAPELLKHENIVYNGKEIPLPSYYLKLIERNFPNEFKILKKKRQDALKQFDPDKTLARLAVSEVIKKAQINLLSEEL